MNPDARPQSQKSCGNADRGFLQASFGPTCDGEAGNVRPEFSNLVWLQRHSSVHAPSLIRFRRPVDKCA